jgi:thiamine biosynthesis lipoprotein
MKAPVLAEFRKHERLMGSAFEFIVVDDIDSGDARITDSIAEVRRIEALLTEFSSTSDTARINAGAGLSPVSVDNEVYALIERCKRLSSFTQGAFDITAGVLKKLYNFKGETFNLPDQDTIQRTLQDVGSDKIIISPPDKVHLTKPGMRISFAAVGKGYAADKVKAMLQGKGVQSGVINASGDLTVWGKRPDGSPWKVGIADPSNRSKILLWIPVENASVATSGDYEQYFELAGKRFSHTIDPKTGKPVSSIKSVTVVSPSAELSDAVATAVFVLGVEVGMNFVEQLPHTHAVLIDDNDKVFISRYLKIQTV